MSIEEQHVALPKLYGAPAYGRPPRSTTQAPRPFDPDELPLEALMTEEDRELAAGLAGQSQDDDADPAPSIQARSFSIRGLAGRILRQDEARKSA